MLSVLIGVLIICIVGAICFWAIDKFINEARLANLLKLLVVLDCLAAILQRVLPLAGIKLAVARLPIGRGVELANEHGRDAKLFPSARTLTDEGNFGDAAGRPSRVAGSSDCADEAASCGRNHSGCAGAELRSCSRPDLVRRVLRRAEGGRWVMVIFVVSIVVTIANMFGQVQLNEWNGRSSTP